MALTHNHKPGQEPGKQRYRGLPRVPVDPDLAGHPPYACQARGVEYTGPRTGPTEASE